MLEGLIQSSNLQPARLLTFDITIDKKQFFLVEAKIWVF